MKRPGRKNVNNVEDKVAFRICNPAMLKSMAYLSDAEKGDNLKKKIWARARCTLQSTQRCQRKSSFLGSSGLCWTSWLPQGILQFLSSYRVHTFYRHSSQLLKENKYDNFSIYNCNCNLLVVCNGTSKRGRVNWIGLDNNRTWVQCKRYKYTDFRNWAFDALIRWNLFSNIVYPLSIHQTIASLREFC